MGRCVKTRSEDLPGQVPMIMPMEAQARLSGADDIRERVAGIEHGVFMTERDTALLDGTAAPIDDKALVRLLTIEGMAEDRSIADLVPDGTGDLVAPPFDLHEATWTVDLGQGALLSLSPGAASIFGRPIIDLRTNPGHMIESVHQDDQATLVEMLNIQDYDDACVRDLRIINSAGNHRRLRVEIHLTRHDNGEAKYLHGLMTDVTAEYQRDRNMQRMMRRVQLQKRGFERIAQDPQLKSGTLEQGAQILSEVGCEALDVSRASVWIADHSGKRFQCVDMFEVSECQHLSGLEFSSDQCHSFLSELENTSVLSLDDVQSDDRFENFRALYFDPFHVTASLCVAMIRDGHVNGFVCLEQTSGPRDWLDVEKVFAGRIAEQITHLLERQIRQNTESGLLRFKTLIEQSAHGFSLTEDGVFTYVNEALAHMCGYQRDDLLGQRALSLIVDSELPQCDEIRQELMSDTPQSSRTIKHVRRDGTEFPAVVNLMKQIDLPTKNSYVAASTIDISESVEAKEILQEERRRLEAVLNNLPGMVFRIRNTPDWPVEFISQGSIALTGWTPEELIEGKITSHSSCVFPDDKDRVWQAMQVAVASREKYEVEYRIIHADGTIKWVWEQGGGVYDGEQCLALEGYLMDITDRVHATQSLLENETRYRELVDNMQTGVVVFEVRDEGQNFYIQEVNKAVLEIEGMDAGDLVGHNAADCPCVGGESDLVAVLRRVYATGTPEHLPHQLHENGQLISSRNQYVYRLPTGEVILVFEDLTEEHQAKSSLELKQMSIDLAKDAMIWVTPDGSLLDANERACELYATNRSELLSRTIFDLTVSYTSSTWDERWEQLRSIKSVTHESCHQRFDGSLFPVEVSARFLEVGGQEYHCTMIRDLTDIKNHEAKIRHLNENLEERVIERTSELKESQSQLLEAEKMAALGRLVAEVTHEVNTPLGLGVTAVSHLRDVTKKVAKIYRAGEMKRSEFEETLTLFEETTGIVMNNLERATQLIQGFKGVAVDQSGEARRDFELRGYLNETLLSLKPRLKRSHIDVMVECPDGIMIDSYPGALSQVVTNLVINALIHAFTPKQNGRINIVATSDGDVVSLMVQDNGCGMSPESKERIYEPFFTTKRGEGGSGLGMHVVYTVVTQTLAGRINCESSPGLGTTFKIDFPRNRGHNDE
jgi:PAS domain S-box-containing protein